MAELYIADYVVFAVLLLASALVGPFYMWRNRRKNVTAESYFVGNRNMHVIPIAVSMFASFWSATALIGIPAELYTGGAGFFMSSVGQVIGMFLGALFVVPMMYNLKLISTYEYLDMRFNRSKPVRYVGIVEGVIASLFSLAVTAYAPCVALSAVTPIPVWASVFATGTITMIYTVLGGIQAVVVVDLIQALIMFLGVLIAIIVGYSKIDGGFSNAMDIASSGSRLNFFDWNPDLRNTYSIYAMVIPAIFHAAGHHTTSQSAVQRYSAVANVQQAIWSTLALSPQIVVFQVLLLFLALAMYVHYELQGCDPLRGEIISSQNQLSTYYVSEVLNYPGLVGLWFAALFSGALSTMSSGYNSVAAVIWQNLLKERYETKLGPNGISWTLKLITLLLGIASSLLAILFESVPGSVIKLTMSTVHVFGGAVFLCYFAGALIPFVNATGATSGMVLSTIFTAFVSAGQMIYGLGNEDVWLPTTTDNCASVFNLPLPDSWWQWTSEQTPTDVDMSVLSGSGSGDFPTVGKSLKAWNDPETLAPGLRYLFSVSYFLFPIISLFLGVVIAIVVSLLTGGLAQARQVDQRLLIVKNCFCQPARQAPIAAPENT